MTPSAAGADDLVVKTRSREATGVVRKAVCQPAGLVYHCFDRIVIHGYLSGLSRPEQVVHLSKDVLSQRTNDYQNWVEAFAGNHELRIECAEREFANRIMCCPGCDGW